MSTIYIETSIIGYLTARSRDRLIFAGRQELTRQWWRERRHLYDLVTSQLVIDEAGRGDPEAAAERLAYLEDVELLDSSDLRIVALAETLLQESLLPENARSDALHVATAAVHRVEYLLTWNCRHIANADQLPKIYRCLSELGYGPPLIVTPDEFSSHE
ncbi:MAG: type II toxin-antitoxin system VapC family toxin [Planctomycetaceae bacterium]|nr:type II toxin-antitoxin system VapC family toxin [Planctomycetaceae bacterium]